MAEGKFRRFIRHKKLIFAFLYLIILPIIVISLVYGITYFKNRPVVFNDKNATILKYDETKDFRVKLNVSLVKNATKTSDGKITLTATIDKIQKDISDVNIYFELDNNWKSTKVTNDTPLTIKSGSTLSKGQEYTSTTKNLTFKNIYPIKPLWFVELEAPDIYIKVTYKIKATDKEKKVYVRYTFDDYYSNKTVIDGL